MIAQGWGRVINVASVARFAPGVAGHTLYPAAKSFVIKFSQSLDCELRKKGIHVTAVCPGYTLTEFHAASGMADLVSQRPRRFGADPTAVVAEALAANARGRVVVVSAHDQHCGGALPVRCLIDGSQRARSCLQAREGRCKPGLL